MPKGIYKRKPRITKYAPGTVHSTPAGDIIILEYLHYKDRQNRVVIRFLETGYVANVQVTNIAAGKIKDRRKRTVYGVGYLGSEIKIPSRDSGSIIRRLYDLWANMLKRAYGGYDKSYSDVEVDKRWHSFTTFMRTIVDVPGYLEWEKGENLVLDKDIRIPGNRVYSRDTCVFITPSENSSDASKRRWATESRQSFNTKGRSSKEQLHPDHARQAV